MMWFPIAYLGDNVRWRGVDDRSAQVTFSDSGKSVTARMDLDGEGCLTNFVAMRYGEVDGDFSLDLWSTPVTDYGVRAGLNLPVGGQAVWNLPSGDLSYAHLVIAELEYNSTQ